MEKNKLVTVAIIGYRHYRYIYCAIDSILAQSYENMELIISDDGSDSFPQEEIRDYIESNKRSNIKRVVLNHEKENSGTVKHLNKVVSLATGAYFLLLAADDALHDETVIAKFVRGFANAGEDCYIEMAQTAMYDENLEALEGYYLRPCIRKLIEDTETNSEELYRFLLNTACLPTNSTFYKTSFFKAFGSFDESYHLIEDVPTHIRLAREGWKIHYENFVAAKHRFGGISHGATEALSNTTRLYYKDWIAIKKDQEKRCETEFDASDEAIKTILRRCRYERKRAEKSLKSVKPENKKTFKNFLANTHKTQTDGGIFLLAAAMVATPYAPQIAGFLGVRLDLTMASVFLNAVLALGALWLLVGCAGRIVSALDNFYININE